MPQDCFRAIIRGKVGDVAIQQVLHYRIEDGFTFDVWAGTTLIVDWILVQVINPLMVAMPSNYNGATVEAQRVNNGGGPTVSKLQHVTGNFAGTGTNNVIACPYVTFDYQEGTRWGHQHFTFPGLWLNFRPPNRVPAIQRLAMQVFLNSLTVTGIAYPAHVVHTCWNRKTKVYTDPVQYSVRNHLWMQKQRRVWGKTLNLFVPYP